MEEQNSELNTGTKKLKKKTVEEAPSEEETLAQLDFEKGMECPKCKEKKIVSWMEQTRASDEPPTRFYKCVNCGYTWREYS
ncbi:MAG: Transcription factor TFIIS [Candidatus Parvarchaeum acidophilus ARMAN-5]|jgi:DNA-directed RNA polymerase subunit M|uniref:Transcription factor TFIIS n=1 Tax=Candidatus Parvarchaeum acidophilus ARMAN-5 TaxID=662762 RepID=D6GUI8_PARA5|nr:MAG: Transcription factor TFIIS [Candidatus Parvarchaeum acidophilus ARMAN-5]